jgi:transposase
VPITLELLQQFMQDTKNNADSSMERHLSRGEHIDAHMALGAKRAIEELERKIKAFEQREKLEEAYEQQHQRELARRRSMRRGKPSLVA